MQKGIGRTGFLLLALGTLIIGAFGFALTWAAFQAGLTMFFSMGLGLAGSALVLLFLFATFGSKPSTEIETPTPAPQVAPQPKEHSFEFQDYQPAAQAAPEKLVLPSAFQTPEPKQETVEFHAPAARAQTEQPMTVQSNSWMPSEEPAGRFTPAPTVPGRDPAAWPGARGKSTWTNEVEHKRKMKEQVEESNRRHNLSEKYTRTTPTLRSILDDGIPASKPASSRPPLAQAMRQVQQEQVEERLADRAPRDMNTDFVAPGMNIGQCGQCKTLLLAPQVRPLRLKCPECAKVTLLS